MSSFKIIVTDDRFGDYKEEEEVFRSIDAELIVNKDNSNTGLMELAKDADALLVNLFPADKSFINGLNKCRIISRYGVGYDNVDIAAATNKNIWVSIVADYCLEEAAEHALSLLFGCARKIVYHDRKIRKGKWNLHDKQPVNRIGGKVLGIIGYGAIGSTFHRKVSGIGFAKVLVYDPFVEPGRIREMRGEPVHLDTLLKESDFISIHAPYSKETHHLINKKSFSLVKNSAILINTSRGGLIEQKALIEALQKGEIGYAGLDVYEKEPLPENSLLRKMENVILSDHFAYYSLESLSELKTKAARNIVQVLKGEKPLFPVNSL